MDHVVMAAPRVSIQSSCPAPQRVLQWTAVTQILNERMTPSLWKGHKCKINEGEGSEAEKAAQ